MEPAPKRRFGFVKTTASQRAALVENAVPKSTRTSTNFWVTQLSTYCEERRLKPPLDFAKNTPEELAMFLEAFYADLQKKDGSEYKRNSYLAARAAIQRHLSSFNRQINIFSDTAFTYCNKVLDGKLKEKKREGREPSVEHKPVITDSDMERLGEYFQDAATSLDPRKLSFYVWFHLSSHFCL